MTYTECVFNFIKEKRAGGVFYMDALIEAVSKQRKDASFDSVSRALRHLRQTGRIDYAIQSTMAQKTVYFILKIES